MTAFDNETFDTVTGELPLREVSALPAGKLQLVSGNELELALFKIIQALPVAIGRDEEATITGSLKRKYATLKAIMSVVRPIALANGVRIRQGSDHAWQMDTAQGKGRAVPVYTDFIHSGTGQTERTVVEVPLLKLDAQSMGSAISYGRRYGILAALGLTTGEDDDDGAAAMPRKKISENVVEESQELWQIKAEIRECSTLKELTEWGRKADEAGRIERLTEDERPLAYLFNSDRIKALRYAHENPPTKSK